MSKHLLHRTLLKHRRLLDLAAQPFTVRARTVVVVVRLDIFLVGEPLGPFLMRTSLDVHVVRRLVDRLALMRSGCAVTWALEQSTEKPVRCFVAGYSSTRALASCTMLSQSSKLDLLDELNGAEIFRAVLFSCFT